MKWPPRDLTAGDPPGHVDYARHMISGSPVDAGEHLTRWDIRQKPGWGIFITASKALANIRNVTCEYARAHRPSSLAA